MDFDADMKQVGEMMLESFHRLSKPEQIRAVLLAGNAEFVIRMAGNQNLATEVGGTTDALLQALTRGIEQPA